MTLTPLVPEAPETQTLLRRCCVTCLLSTVFVSSLSFSYSLTVTQDNHRDRTLHHPYQHPVIQKAINITWFCDSVGDGLVFNKHFSPLPVPAIAFIVTTVRDLCNFVTY